MTKSMDNVLKQIIDNFEPEYELMCERDNLHKQNTTLKAKCDRYEEGIKHIYTHMHTYNLEHVEAMMLHLLNTEMSIKEIKKALANEQSNDDLQSARREEEQEKSDTEGW